MKKDEILNLIQGLARSQGCWGRLLRDIHEMDDESQQKFWDYLEEQNFQSSLDCVLFLEGNP